METLVQTVENDVKRHLYIKKFMEFVNKRAHRITFLGLGQLANKKVDIREEYAKFLKHSKLDAKNKELNQEVVDFLMNWTKDKKYEMTYLDLYEASRKCYDESTSRMFNHLEKRPGMFRDIYLNYFPSKNKDMGMEL